MTDRDGRTGRRGIVAAAVLGVLVALAFGINLGGEFVWDDRPLIVENARVQDPARLGSLLTSGFWETGDRHDRFRDFFRPVVSLTYAMDFAVWGLSPVGFHLSNLLLHWICCWWVYRILDQEGLGLGALAGAALFAVHPVHVENVAWISGRTDLVCAAFMLAAFAVYRRTASTQPQRPSLPALILFALSLFAKEMAATLPILVGVDACLRCAAGHRRRWFGRLLAGARAAAPYLFVLVAYVLLRRALLGAGTEPLFELGPASFVATALFVMARYVTLLLLPVGLDAHHPDGPMASLVSAPVAVSAVILAIVAVAAWRLGRRNGTVTFWILWVPISFLPVLAFGRFGDVILADRFLYIPSVGLAALAAHGTAGAVRWLAHSDHGLPHARRMATAAAVVLLTALTVGSLQRSRVWHDDLTLFSDMATTSPDSALVNCNLGLAYYHRGRFDEAIVAFQDAISHEPSYAMAHNNLAATYELRGRDREALRHYLVSLDLAPEQFEAGVNAGHLLTRLGQPDEGIARLRDAVRRFPDSPRAHYHLGEALERSGSADAALPHLETARRLDPEYANPYFLLGKTYDRQGRRDDAERALRRFLELWDADDVWAKAARAMLGEDRSASAL